MGYLSFFTFCIFFEIALALICYQTDDKTGAILEVDNDEFILCVFFPEKRNQEGAIVEKSFATAISTDEVEEPIEEFFKNDNRYYKLLSVCLHEQYNWPKMLHLSRNGKTPDTDNQFRCICNTNLCNSANSFKSFTTV